MNDIPYNFPVMEKAKKEREKLWDIYGLKDIQRKEKEDRLWEKEWARIHGEEWYDDWDDYVDF